MNLSHIAFSDVMDSIGGGSLKLPLKPPDRPQDDPLLAIHTGFSIGLILTLGTTRRQEKTSLTPWRRHTILAEQIFSFAPSDDGLGFEIKKLDDEVRRHYRLPSGCTTFVLAQGSPLEVGTISQASVLYVDEKILQRIQAAPNSRQARGYQRTIGAELVGDLIMRSHAELQRAEHIHSSLSDLEGTLASRIVSLLWQKAKPSSGPRLRPEDVYQELVTEPQRLVCRAQALFNLRPLIIDTLSGEGEPDDL
jgi:hypothetical protein